MIRIKLTIEIPENFDAEDSLSNILQDEGLLSDLIEWPVKGGLRDYLREDYGRLLNVIIKATLE